MRKLPYIAMENNYDDDFKLSFIERAEYAVHSI